jgi:hypothetical protein
MEKTDAGKTEAEKAFSKTAVLLKAVMHLRDCDKRFDTQADCPDCGTAQEAMVRAQP